jgi:hypothetical protein
MRSAIEKPTNYTDKEAWYKYGETTEKYFAEVFCPSIGIHNIRINPEKEYNQYAPDLLIDDNLADLKGCYQPFFLTQRKFGMPPESSVSFDRIDYCRYMSNYSSIKTIFWLDWDKQHRFGVGVPEVRAICVLPLADIHKLVIDKTAKEFNIEKRGFDKDHFKRNVLTGEHLGNYVIPLAGFPYLWKGA